MKFTVNKEELLEKLHLAARFTSVKLSTLTTLQGVCLEGQGDSLHFYASNLSSYFHTTLKSEGVGGVGVVVDPKKTAEFISLLSSAKITLEVDEKRLLISSEKTRGSFPVMSPADFPLPPKIAGKAQVIKTDFLLKNLPMVAFAASGDESRPILTGVNFLTGEDLAMVSTDGFRLSLVRTKKEIEIPSAIIPSDFLLEVVRYIKEEKEVGLHYLAEEKTVAFTVGETQFYSRLIDGEFPPFEKVIPTQKATTVTVDSDELLRSVKLASVFARDFSNVVVLFFKKSGLECRPKMDAGEENSAFQESVFEGEEQKVAFNF
ncbi:DNA polymerase III subunit beta, partial [Candidatus Roizmanbacteria bacterium]|nr:DNA polymerase III subunit beta [Candidatus Roizmanbacteria bacterium]